MIIEVRDIHAVKKKNTAKVLPNALSITTNNGDKVPISSVGSISGLSEQIAVCIKCRAGAWQAELMTVKLLHNQKGAIG